VLNLDALATGQKVPIGLVPYGPIDLVQWHDGGVMWPFTWFLGKSCQPGPTEWPTTESYFDVRFLIMLNEFCTDQTMGPNAYVWGYLAARDALAH
jgi:endoglucanase